MRISFRQGLVNTGLTNFLSVSSNYVTLTVTSSPFIATIASGDKDYLWIESSTVTNAWGPISAGQDTWLYIDLDVRTATRTFGTTITVPSISTVAPTSPSVNQHWYDTKNHQMNVWIGTAWVPKARVFVAKLSNGSVPTSVSMNSPVFTGSQVGDTTEVHAGQILFDTEDMPIRQLSGKFVTTEDKLRTRVQSTAEVKLASVQLEAQAGENLAKYTIVTFSDFGVVEHATLFSSSVMGQFGIIERDVTTGQLVNVVTTGVVTNIDWDWSSVGVNKPLYCDGSGQLASTPQIAGQDPIAIIVDRHSIQLGTPNLHIQRFDFASASTSQFGVSKLSVAAVDPADPIAVGTNDPRMSDARTPLAHVHTVSDVTNLQLDLDAKVNVSGATMTGDLVLSSATPLSNLSAASKSYVDTGDSLKVNKAGDTITGALNITSTLSVTGAVTLGGDPVNATDAATKQYVDNNDALKINLAGGTMTGSLTLSGAPTLNLHAATKQYVDTSVSNVYVPTVVQLACSDLVTALTATTNVAYFYALRAFTLKKIQISLMTASTSGSVSVQISKNGTAITGSPFSIAVSTNNTDIDVSASNISIAVDDHISIDITAGGTSAKGLIVGLLG